MNFIFNRENLKFAFLVYLVNICFLTSLSQCIYFLSYYSRSLEISLFGYFSFIVVVVIAFFSIKFKQFYLTLIFNAISIKFILKLKEFLAKGQKNYSYICFILFHFYIAFSIFHFMMVNFYQIEVTFELVYQLLNLIRLFFFPLILLMVTFTLFPDFFKMEGLLSESSNKLIGQAISQLLDFLKEQGNIKKNPKTAGFIYVVTGAGLVATSHKYQLQEQFRNTTEKFGIDFANVPPDLLNVPGGYELYKAALNTISVIDRSAFYVLATDIQSFLTKNPTLGEKLAQDLVDFKAAEALSQAKKQQIIDKANEIGFSPLAVPSTDSKTELSSSAVSKILTIIEKLVFDN